MQATYALAWYGAGLGLLGGAVGYFVGASQSPVVATVLPLLFGLASGAGGLFLAKADLSKGSVREKLQAFGKTTAVFVILLLVGVFVGIASRTGVGLSSLFSGLWSGSTETPIAGDKLSPLDAVRLIMLRSNLTAIGATPEEQQVILTTATPAPLPALDAKQASSALEEVAKLSAIVRDRVKPIVESQTQQTDVTSLTLKTENQKIAESVNGVQLTALMLAREADYFARQLRGGTRAIPADVLASRIEYYADRISVHSQSEHLNKWLTQQAAIGDAIYDLQLSLTNLRRQLIIFATQDSSLAVQANTEIGAFLVARSDPTAEISPSWTGNYLARAELPPRFGMVNN